MVKKKEVLMVIFFAIVDTKNIVKNFIYCESVKDINL